MATPTGKTAAVALAASLLLLSRMAGAQVVNEASARIAFAEGLRLRDEEHDPRRALEKLKAAHELAVTARTGYELGATYLLLGSLVEAEHLFLEVTRLPEDPAQSAAAKEARERSKRLSLELESRIPAIVVRLTGAAAPGAEVYVDGTRVPDAARSLPWKANPGPHQVLVKVTGQPDRSRALTLVEGSSESVDVDLTVGTSPAAPSTPSTAQPVTGSVAQAPAPPAPQASTWNTPRIVGVSLAGAGVAALAVGGVLALGAKSSFDDARGNQCGSAIGAPNDSQCTASGLSARQSAGSKADVASVLFVVGASAVAGGAVLWLVSAPSARAGAGGAVGVGITPAGFFTRGTF